MQWSKIIKTLPNPPPADLRDENMIYLIATLILVTGFIFGMIAGWKCREMQEKIEVAKDEEGLIESDTPIHKWKDQV